MDKKFIGLAVVVILVLGILFFGKNLTFSVLNADGLPSPGVYATVSFQTVIDAQASEFEYRDSKTDKRSMLTVTNVPDISLLNEAKSFVLYTCNTPESSGKTSVAWASNGPNTYTFGTNGGIGSGAEHCTITYHLDFTPDEPAPQEPPQQQQQPPPPQQAPPVIDNPPAPQIQPVDDRPLWIGVIITVLVVAAGIYWLTKRR